jgi:hypothetical protein
LANPGRIGFGIDDPYVEGARIRLALVDGNYRLPVSLPNSGSLALDFNLEVARGNVSGIEPFEKFGHNTDIDTGSTPEDVWEGGGLYTGHPTGSAETIEVFSSDANDTSAGTGLRTLELTGQLAGVVQTETVTLNGTTPVITTNTWDRMYRAKGLTAGSGGENAGTITCRHSTTTANVFAGIPAGSNRSQICAFTVPTGKTLYMTHADIRLVRASGALGSALSTIMIRESGGIWEQTYLSDITTSGSESILFNSTFICPALTDIVVRILNVSDNNSSVTAQLFGYLVDD